MIVFFARFARGPYDPCSICSNQGAVLGRTTHQSNAYAVGFALLDCKPDGAGYGAAEYHAAKGDHSGRQIMLKLRLQYAASQLGRLLAPRTGRSRPKRTDGHNGYAVCGDRRRRWAPVEISTRQMFGSRRPGRLGAMQHTKPPADDYAMIVRLEAGLPPSSPEEAAARAPYERLIARIGELEEVGPLPGWEERAVARWRARKQNDAKGRG